VQNRQNLDHGLISQKSRVCSVQRINSWTGRVCSVHRGPTPAQTEGTAVRSPEPGGGGAKRRGERGELGSGLTGARAALGRPSDGGAERGGGGTQWEVAVDSEAND
jgi:hypothetical protein